MFSPVVSRMIAPRTTTTKNATENQNSTTSDINCRSDPTPY